MELLTAAQMRAIEQAAISAGEVTGLELMERAGRGVVEAIFEAWPELEVAGGPAPQTPRSISEEMKRAVVLCGPGNNGGDGFVVARLLKERGWEVEVFLYGDPERLPPDALVNYKRWHRLGEVQPVAAGAVLLKDTDVLLDALFGTGLTRPNTLSLAELIREDSLQYTEALPRCVAVDVPSGLCADSGRALGHCAQADLTVSFECTKLGHVLAEGPHFCGKVVVKEIGLSSFVLPEVTRLQAPHIARRAGVRPGAPWLGKGVGHKFSHGHALILSGGFGRTGAARLAARGALRGGAGLVTMGVPGAAQMEVAAQITALMMTRVDGADALAEVLQDRRINALCLGPGLGQDRARDLVPVALDGGRATVLDADALSAFATDPATLFSQLHNRCVLTPHGGEFARLFPDIAARLAEPAITGPAYSKLDATRAAAERAGCVVLFKGADTVIAAPDGPCSISAAVYDRAAPWLATAGSGDVLAGFITGLLARGVPPQQAAEIGAWLHVECARRFGPGLIAEDLPEQLPAVYRDLGL